MEVFQPQLHRRGLLGAAAGSVALSASAQEAPATTMRASGVLQLPAREIPPPSSISPMARASLVAGANAPRGTSPDVSDVAGWRANIADIDRMLAAQADRVLGEMKVTCAVRRVGEVDIYVASRNSSSASDRGKVNLYLHGGAFIYGGGPGLAVSAAANASWFGGVVHAVDYRRPPDHPFPAALEDCLAVYRDLLRRHRPETILVSGESAGGNLAAALMHKARDVGLPAPRALFLNSPVTDLTESSDSLVTNRGVDVVLSSMTSAPRSLYAAGADLRSPYVSPLHGDHSRGFPDTYIRTGTRDLLLSDSVRLHAALRRSGVAADLFVAEAMPHGGFAVFGPETPEDVAAREDAIRWLSRRWTSG